MANKNNKGGRPKVHWWIAQEVYVLVDEVERQNKPITRRQAIYKFMEGDKFKNLLTNYHKAITVIFDICNSCLLYTSPSPRDGLLSRMPSSA